MTMSDRQIERQVPVTKEDRVRLAGMVRFYSDMGVEEDKEYYEELIHQALYGSSEDFYDVEETVEAFRDPCN